MTRSLFATLLMLFFALPAYSLERSPLDEYPTVQGVLKTSVVYGSQEQSPPMKRVGVEARLGSKVLFSEYLDKNSERGFIYLGDVQSFPKKAPYKILIFKFYDYVDDTDNDEREDYRFSNEKYRIVDLSVKGKTIVTPMFGDRGGLHVTTEKNGNLLLQLERYGSHPSVYYEYSTQEGLKAIKPPVPKNDIQMHMPADSAVIPGIECYLQEGMENFCSAKYAKAVKNALKTRKPDFYKKYIVVTLEKNVEGKETDVNVIAVDSTTGVGYPLPFDYVTGHDDAGNTSVDKPQLNYNIRDNEICIKGISWVVGHQAEDPCYKPYKGAFIDDSKPKTAPENEKLEPLPESPPPGN